MARLEVVARRTIQTGKENMYAGMDFTGGDTCWNGPARSLRARVVCGAVAGLRGISEPSRCEYEAEMATPAACDEGEAGRLGREAEEVEEEARAAWRDEL